jgi:predicted GNAT family acetyltransferase
MYGRKGTENERTEKIDIVFEQDRNRSAAYINGDQIGECEFSVSENVWMITHTGVRSEYGGRGIAKKLVLKVIESARTNNAKIVPICSYAEKLMSGKEEFKDVLY